jgi:microcystin-dependent protein
MADPFVAEIRIFPFNFAPKGWAFCDGQLLPLSQNTALFSLLGTTYGGDGRSNFALPNLQGSAPMHTGQGPGLSLHDLGETGDRTPLACSSPKCPPTATPSAPTVTSPTSSHPSPARSLARSQNASAYQTTTNQNLVSLAPKR